MTKDFKDFTETLDMLIGKIKSIIEENKITSKEEYLKEEMKQFDTSIEGVRKDFGDAVDTIKQAFADYIEDARKLTDLIVQQQNKRVSSTMQNINEISVREGTSYIIKHLMDLGKNDHIGEKFAEIIAEYFRRALLFNLLDLSIALKASYEKMRQNNTQH